MRRGMIPGLASGLTGIVLSAGVVCAQDVAPTARRGTLTGIVTDSVTGLPVPEAPVRLSAGWPVLTDSAGRFVLKETPQEGQVSLAVDQPGYADYFAMVDVSVPQLILRLMPEPGTLPGLQSIAAELRQTVGFRRNAHLYTRRDLLTAREKDLHEFLMHRGVHPPLRSRFPGPDDPIGLGIVLDRVSFNDLAAVPSRELIDLYAVVVADGGATVRIWTTRYIEQLARTSGHLCGSVRCW